MLARPSLFVSYSPELVMDIDRKSERATSWYRLLSTLGSAATHTSARKGFMTRPDRPTRLRVRLLLAMLMVTGSLAAQTITSVTVQVLDPTGAVVTSAKVTLATAHQDFTASLSHADLYIVPKIPSGRYDLLVTAPGFAEYRQGGIDILPAAQNRLRVRLLLPVEHQHVTITGHSEDLSLQASENASATVISGNELNALSDDPAELQNELQALAGPGAGPNGAQLYIDGFTGGILPPKTSIREILINNNPFSAQYERIGYGRVEIITKSSLRSVHGHLLAYGNDSALNTANPLVAQHPSYYSDVTQGSITGPLTHRMAYLVNGVSVARQDQDIVDAVNPLSVTSSVTAAVPHSSIFQYVSPRLDISTKSGSTLTLEDSLYHGDVTGLGVGALNLAQQAYNNTYWENAVEFHSTWSAGANLANEAQGRWLHVRNSQISDTDTPSITVQGAFISGGNTLGAVEDHQDIIEADDYVTTSLHRVLLEAGGSGRLIRDANHSTSGSNGAYTFNAVSSYLSATPTQYQVTQVALPTARALLFNGALFVQSEWRWKPNLDVSAGFRMEGQNRISNHMDSAPRFAFSWSPRSRSNQRRSVVVHGGYGWFYNRFTMPTYFNSTAGTPYIIQAIHDNGRNQIPYVVNHPTFYNAGSATAVGALPPGNQAIPTSYTIASRFHAALNMQGAAGVDWQIGKANTVTATYLNTRGIHQYMTDNLTAPQFDAETYSITGPPPTRFNYQFESNGIYKQQQIIVTESTRLKRLNLHAVYTYEDTHSDTQGVGYFPSVSDDPTLDYGRASFAVTNQVVFLASYRAPWSLTVAPYLTARSGVPYNITVGSDLTENNQFNARPTFGTCGTPGVIETEYGCLDSAPAGKGESIIPYDLGTGPANAIVNLRISKTLFLFRHPQPHTKRTGHSNERDGYRLTLFGIATNLFNIVNLGTPNGVLASPLFGESQTLAGGQFSTGTPGNRSIAFQAMISF